MPRKKNVTLNDIVTHQKGEQKGDKHFTNNAINANKESNIIMPEKNNKKKPITKGNNKEASKIEMELEGRFVYNKKISILDTRYTQDHIIMLHDNILVRLLLLPGVHGFTVKPETIAVPNRAGTGEWEELTDQYPYDNIGVVVNIANSTSKEFNIKKGDFVRVDNLITQTKFAQGRQYLKNAYFHHDAANDMQFEGYVKVRPYDIVNTLPNFNLKSYVKAKHKRDDL